MNRKKKFCPFFIVIRFHFLFIHSAISVGKKCELDVLNVLCLQTSQKKVKARRANRYSFFIHGQIFHKFSFVAMETSQHIVMSFRRYYKRAVGFRQGCSQEVFGED